MAMTEQEKKNYATHETRGSDSSVMDEICVRCGAHDEVPGDWGDLIRPCPKETEEHAKQRLGIEDHTLPSRKRAMEGEPSYNDLARALKWAVGRLERIDDIPSNGLESARALAARLKFT